MPLRQTRGFVCSLFQMLGIDLASPHYSILSRRARKHQLELGHRPHKVKHLAFDSSGLKVFGEGEWKVRQHRAEYRRTWRKLHISIDADTLQIISLLVTGPKVGDPKLLPKLLDQLEADVESVYADGAYDSRECYSAIHKKRARPIIPPRKGSTTWKDGYLEDRNENVERVKKVGQKEWKMEVGYHLRSLVETAFYRLKWILSDRLRSRNEERDYLQCISVYRDVELTPCAAVLCPVLTNLPLALAEYLQP